MIEIHLTKNGASWDVTATKLPYGGLGVAKVARLTRISEPSVVALQQAVQNLSSVEFVPDQDRWPVPEPKFQIINQWSHPDPKHFGNYTIERGGSCVGTVPNFARGEALNLIRAALIVLAQSQHKL